MSFDAGTLFQLMPAIHRVRDAEIAGGLPRLLTPAEAAELAGLEALASPTAAQQERMAELRDRASRGPLRALFGIFADEIGAMEENLDQLYDDLFVETCAEWVLPYIGDLIGYRLLHGNTPAGDRRAEVAHTIAFRRRKGTLAMLEQLARDVTAWDARAVEYFQLLSTTQYMNHLRRHNVVTPDLRDGLALERVGTAFDSIPRTFDARRIVTGRGRYNIPNIGIFLWRLGAQRRGPCPPAPHPGDATGRRLRFSPLGNDLPLHTRPERDSSLTALAGPLDVPAPITRRALRLARPSDYGAEASIAVLFDGALFPVANIRSCHLGDVPGTGGADWAHDAPSGTVAVDPMLGRLVVAADVPLPGTLLVTYHEAGPADFAGGAYARSAAFKQAEGAVVRVPADQPTVQAALDALGGLGVVEITDSRTYQEALSIDVAPGKTIELRAAEGARPLLVLPAPMALTGGADATVVLNGLLIAGDALDIAATGHDLARLEIRHATLVPGRAIDAQGTPSQPGAPSVTVRRDDLELVIERSIVGSVRAVPAAKVSITDSIVDASSDTNIAFATPDASTEGAPLTLDACTVIGEVYARTLDVSNAILLSPAVATRRQQGCVRFSFLPLTSLVARRYRCQPDPDNDSDAAPTFTTLRYGAKGYARLSARTPAAIRRGADDESEMGVYHYLYEPQRESDLRTRLDEYLRVGLEAGILHES